jgi:hypothetical protein
VFLAGDLSFHKLTKFVAEVMAANCPDLMNAGITESVTS